MSALISHPVTRTNTAPPLPDNAGISIGIVERMSVLAMRFLCVNCRWSSIAKNIYAQCHRLKMVWINARFVFAKVVDCKPFRNWPDKQSVCISMCRNANGWSLGHGESSISTRDRSSPNPAIAALINVSPKANVDRIKSRSRKRGAVPSVAHVMRVAQPMSFNDLDASFNFAPVSHGNVNCSWLRLRRQYAAAART